jgi:hypothetical protein
MKHLSGIYGGKKHEKHRIVKVTSYGTEEDRITLLVCRGNIKNTKNVIIIGDVLVFEDTPTIQARYFDMYGCKKTIHKAMIRSENNADSDKNGYFAICISPCLIRNNNKEYTKNIDFNPIGMKLYVLPTHYIVIKKDERIPD